jgi:hypothetical protein
MKVVAKIYSHINIMNNNRFGVFSAVKIRNVVCRVMAPSGLVASYVSDDSVSSSSE